MDKLKISLKKIVGKKYNRFWHFKGRYRVIKGSRASKKSKTTALWYITNMMKYPGANTLVVRKTFRTLKDSCFTELKWAITRLQVQDHWKITESPLQLTYIPTGQTIYFRGLDDPLKVTSITVDVGSLCWMWIEEAYEIMKEPDFDILDESIRGQVDEEIGFDRTQVVDQRDGGGEVAVKCAARCDLVRAASAVKFELVDVVFFQQAQRDIMEQFVILRA